jgi:hypothetical protein
MFLRIWRKFRQRSKVAQISMKSPFSSLKLPMIRPGWRVFRIFVDEIGENDRFGAVGRREVRGPCCRTIRRGLARLARRVSGTPSNTSKRALGSRIEWDAESAARAGTRG